MLAGALIGLTGGAVTALIGGLAAIPILGIPDAELATTYGGELQGFWLPAGAVAGLVLGLAVGAGWRGED